jgi:hypothetical protein
MTENTDIEFNESEGIHSIDEGINIPVPNPWDDAPTDVYFYEKIYEDGHLGSFTPSAELAYKSGWDLSNYIAI